ncbi:nucleotide exchange factor GrpE [Actinomadura craniellae]|uniref:nucleotide exchange factor GrpE n=1 Tax=Actinomadura craniellae TaxID=2231787 RepID=UPI001F23CF47|nr:nucleotide exchange factor GrpE [Actinomadura craniellae]
MSSAEELPADKGSHIGELAEIRAALAALTATVERDNERAAHREAIIDRLHEEVQALRRGELQVMYEPVRSALFRLHDMLRREATRWNGPERPDPALVAPLLAAVTDEIAEALARTGIDRFEVTEGDHYDATRHRPVSTRPVTDPACHDTVLTAGSDGFERGGQVVRKAEVVIGRLHADTTSTAPQPDEAH